MSTIVGVFFLLHSIFLLLLLLKRTKFVKSHVMIMSITQTLIWKQRENIEKNRTFHSIGYHLDSCIFYEKKCNKKFKFFWIEIWKSIELSSKLYLLIISKFIFCPIQIWNDNVCFGDSLGPKYRFQNSLHFLFLFVIHLSFQNFVWTVFFLVLWYNNGHNNGCCL